MTVASISVSYYKWRINKKNKKLGVLFLYSVKAHQYGAGPSSAKTENQMRSQDEDSTQERNRGPN
jgi:hypothetical protein